MVPDRLPTHRTSTSAYGGVWKMSIVALGMIVICLLALRGGKAAKEPLVSPTGHVLDEVLIDQQKYQALVSDSKCDHTLVLYLYDSSDAVYDSNFQYFIQYGMAANDGCHYVFVMTEASIQKKTLPELPSNAQYLSVIPSACHFGMSTFGKVLKSDLVARESFKHYIFVNSYARGPFIPAYLSGTMHWSRLFTRLLSEDVKLVGPTVTCENVLRGVDPHLTTNLTAMPYMQFVALATDHTGMRLMQQQNSIFACLGSSWEDEYWSVMMASRVMVNNGYNLASFLMRYRGVDWRNSRNWECNGKLNPVGEFYYDGSTIDPLEVMFVAMNSVVVENNWSFAKQALLYQKWMTEQGAETLDVNSNLWISEPRAIKRQRIAYMQSRGPGCFDHHYYLKKNPDLSVLTTVLQLWDHFVMLGQFEGRSHRWSCDDDRKLPF